jgi:hypothetical protein
MKQHITRWYETYWAQTWYRNTYLVRRARQIAQSIEEDRDWNNIHDAGCNFVCLAMIVGLDPARLASELSTQRYFFADATLRARHVSGKLGGLVWDQNAPHETKRHFKLTEVWHPRFARRVTISLSFVESRCTTHYLTAREIIDAMRRNHLHLVCGTNEHSHLVAGSIGDDYFLWDPDDTAMSIERMLVAKFTLRRFFDANIGETVEFWGYRCDIR